MIENAWPDSLAVMDLLKAYLDITIFGILGLMSFFMLAYAVERTMCFARIQLGDYADPHNLQVALTTATFVAQGKIPVALPPASQAESLAAAGTLEITIDSDGQAYLADRPVTLEQIAEQFVAVATATPLLLRVDEAAPFRHFVAVVDLAKARGLEDLSIVARRGDGG